MKHMGDAQGHVQREAEQRRLRQLSHTHILNDMVAHVAGIPRRRVNPRPNCLRTSQGTGEGS